MHSPDQKKQAQIALKKARSHINKVIQMIEDDEYCIQVIEQIMAVSGLLKSASDKMLAGHLQSCFREGMESGDAEHHKHLINEVVNVLHLKRS